MSVCPSQGFANSTLSIREILVTLSRVSGTLLGDLQQTSGKSSYRHIGHCRTFFFGSLFGWVACEFMWNVVASLKSNYVFILELFLQVDKYCFSNVHFILSSIKNNLFLIDRECLIQRLWFSTPPCERRKRNHENQK